MRTSNRYLPREAVFKTLRKHPGLMVRDDESDTSFVNFYNTMLSTNTYLIDSLQSLINNRQFVEADTLLARFTEDNEQEYNYKKVYAATILWMVNGEDAIDDVLREELTVIAHQHPLFGGYAVYVARNLLQLEIYDELPSNLRLMAEKDIITQRMMNVYPNPANEYIEVSFTDRSIPEQVILRDLTGRICSSFLNSSIVNTTTLLPGIYFMEVMVKGEKHNANIVVAK
jgi:Secretion system C-terminal sorting domain